MARISVSLSGIERTLLNRLSESESAVTLHTLRLAAGKKILAPQDNPSTFLRLSNLQSQLSLVTTTLSNVTAASSRLSQARTNAAAIHDQLDAIRTVLIDPDSNLDAAHRTAAQAEIDEALQQINTLATDDIDGRRLLDGSANYQISGRNAAQVRDLRVYSTGANGQIVAAKQAELTYTGTSRYAAADATIRITGNSGTSSTITISTDDTLEAVAAKINAQQTTTSVTATVEDNTLTLTSAAYGSSRKAAVTVLSGTFTTSGGDGAGTAYGTDVVYGTTPAVSGSVLQAATQAELLYTGSAGKTTAAATFTLTGKRGSDSITVALDEDLDDVAQKINDVSYKTGITAAVDGDELTLTSVDYGTNATVNVTVSSGTFTTTGGNGDGTANGTNATARLNGITYTGNTLAQAAEIRHREKTGLIAHNATVRVTCALGSADIVMTTGQTLAQVAGNINTQTGTTGVRATVDGNDLVLLSTDRGAEAEARIEVLSGTFDTVDDYTAATKAELTYTGTEGRLTDAASFRLTGSLGSFDFAFADDTSLADVRTAINAESATTGVEAYVDGDQLYLRSATSGSSALVAVSLATNFAVTGGNGSGTAQGTNATAEASGQAATTGKTNVDGNRFTVYENSTHYEIEFAGGFSGDFHTMTVEGGGLSFALSPSLYGRSSLSIPSLQIAQLGTLSGNLSQILSGGASSGLGDNTARAIRIVDEALGQLQQTEGLLTGYFNSGITSASTLLDDLQDQLNDAIAETDGYNKDEEETLLSDSEALAANAQASLSLLYDQRMGMVRMLQHIAGLD